MAKVYLGVHQDVPNLKVVLKILSDPRLVERFRQEADKLALLDGHPNICRIKHFFNHGDDIVIAMEYIEGITLEEKIHNEGKIPVEEALKIASEVLDILEFAHQKGVYHRDIKPSNIMIDITGRVKIIDFGIAKAKTDPNLTTAGTACGTPAYMAPEQFVPTADTNYAMVDTYAVGTTLYYMLTGELPFKGDNEFAIRDAKLFTDPPRARELNAEIPRRVDDLVVRSMKKEPGDRFQTALDMQQRIDNIRNDSDVTRAVKDAAENHAPKKKSGRMLIIVIATIILAIAATAIYKFFPSRITKPAPTMQEDTLTTPAEKPDDSHSPITAQLTGTVDISIAPYGDIYLDGTFQSGKTDFASLVADTGKHIIRIENREAVNRVITDTVIIESGETTQKQYDFKMPVPKPETLPTQQTTAYGTLIVGSNPRGADIFIDGELQEDHQTNYSFNKTKPGEHLVKVQLTQEGKLLTREARITVAADSVSKANFDFEK